MDHVKDFVFVLFVGSAVITLMLLIQQQHIPRWLSIFGVFMMLLTLYHEWKE